MTHSDWYFSLSSLQLCVLLLACAFCVKCLNRVEKWVILWAQPNIFCWHWWHLVRKSKPIHIHVYLCLYFYPSNLIDVSDGWYWYKGIRVCRMHYGNEWMHFMAGRLSWKSINYDWLYGIGFNKSVTRNRAPIYQPWLLCKVSFLASAAQCVGCRNHLSLQLTDDDQLRMPLLNVLGRTSFQFISNITDIHLYLYQVYELPSITWVSAMHGMIFFTLSIFTHGLLLPAVSQFFLTDGNIVFFSNLPNYFWLDGNYW